MVYKLDKCHQMMTSPISCQGQLVRAAVHWYQCPVHYPWEPGPHTQSPWELFNGCTVLENQTRQRWSDHRRILLSKRDRTLARVRTSGIYWRTMRHRRNGASFRDLSNIQIQSTKSVQIQSDKYVCTSSNTIPSCLKAKSLYKMYSCWVFLFTKNEYYQMMKSVDSTTYDYVMYFYTKYIHKRRYYNRLINMNQN